MIVMIIEILLFLCTFSNNGTGKPIPMFLSLARWGSCCEFHIVCSHSALRGSQRILAWATLYAELKPRSKVPLPPWQGAASARYLVHHFPSQEPLQQSLNGLAIPPQLHPAEVLLDQQVRTLETGLAKGSHQKAVLMEVIAFGCSVS